MFSLNKRKIYSNKWNKNIGSQRDEYWNSTKFGCTMLKLPESLKQKLWDNIYYKNTNKERRKSIQQAWFLCLINKMKWKRKDAIFFKVITI